MKHFTSRQMFLILAVLSPLFRFILFPASLAYQTGRDSILVIAICMAIEFCSCFCIVYLWKNSGEESFFLSVSRLLSPFVGGVFAVCYALLFFFKLIVFLCSQKLMMTNVIYENGSGFLMFLPILLVLFYVGSKNINSVARLFELSWLFVLASVVAILALSTPAINVENFFPVLDGGGGNVLRSVFSFQIYFGDFAVLLILFSSVRSDFSSKWKMLFAPLCNTAISLAFFAIFFGVFGELSAKQTYAISKLSKYTVAFSEIGRYDFLFILVVGFGFVVLSILHHHTLLACTDFLGAKRWVVSGAVSIALGIAVFFLSQNYQKTLAVATTVLPFFAVFLQTILPILWAIVWKIKSVASKC